MTSPILAQAWRALGRPLLMHQPAALAAFARLRALDPHAARRPAGWVDRVARLFARAPQPLTATEQECEEPAYSMRTPAAYALHGQVAVITIRGELLARGGYVQEACAEPVFVWGYDLIRAAIAQADQDPQAAAILLHLDSPGGVVAPELDELLAFLAARRTAGAKPLHAYAECALSAAYWVGAQADRLVAPARGYLGSIGVIVVHVDQSGALAQEGLAIEAVQAGARKADGAPWAPLSEAARADIQAEVDQIWASFSASVARARALTVDAVQALEARVFPSEHQDPAFSARAIGLIDAVSDFEAALAACAASASSISPGAPARGASVLPAGTAPGAPAAQGAAPPKGKPMTKKSNGAAQAARMILASDMSEEKLARIRAILDEEEPDAEGEEEEIPAAEGEEEEIPAAQGEEEETPAAEGEEEEIPAALRFSAARALAIISLPEARGREGLARALALDPKMGVDQARSLLAASARGGLAARMAGRDPALSPSGAARRSDADASVNFVLAAKTKATGR